MDRQKKKLRLDTRAENVFRAFILLLGCMVIFSAISLVLINHMAESANSINSGYTQDMNVLGLWEYTLIDPDTGYYVGTANTSNTMVHPLDAPFQFTDGDHDDEVKYLQVIRDNANFDPSSSDMWKKYKDFISVQRKVSKTVFFGSHWNGAAISFDYIANKFDTNTNMSVVGFQLSGMNDTLFLNFTSNSTSLLWTNHFTLFYGWAKIRQDRIDFWGTIGMILACQIPGLDPKIQFIVSAFWIFGEVFVGFTMASRIMPFAGGG